jgi:hypothetical protein
MDLSKFDTREKASAGIEAPLVIGGETVFGDDDKPVTFNTKGLDDPDVYALVMKAHNATSRTQKEVVESDLKLARAAITGWSGNFTVGGEKLEYSKANIEKVCSIPLLRKAVLSPIGDEARFMNGS